MLIKSVRICMIEEFWGCNTPPKKHFFTKIWIFGRFLAHLLLTGANETKQSWNLQRYCILQGFMLYMRMRTFPEKWRLWPLQRARFYQNLGTSFNSNLSSEDDVIAKFWWHKSCEEFSCRFKNLICFALALWEVLKLRHCFEGSAILIFWCCGIFQEPLFSRC